MKEIPGPVDLAVIVVPAAAVLDVARECAQKGVRSLVVISAGFGETGEAGVARQQELLQICRDAGMRMIGPNCMGIINTDAAVSMNATFAPAMPPRGRVGFLSQSGALGLAVIDRAAALGLGLSSFVSIGNKADISGNDLLQYWADDEDTDVVLLYLESFGNPRRFSRIARRLARRKPIVAVKSGRSSAGARATSSHTGALLAASDVTVDALFRQAGVIRTDTLSELFDVASLLATQPLPTGRRVAIVTNAGGPGILCADACEAGGLEVPQLSEELRNRLAAFLPDEASLTNPVDMIASASADDYARTIREVAASEDIDAVVVIFIPPLVTKAEDVAAAVRDVASHLPRAIPLVSVFMSSEGIPPATEETSARVPSFAFPEDAARALVRVSAYAEWLERPEGTVPELPDVRRADAAEEVSRAVDGGGGWLAPDAVERLLSCFGIPVAASRLAGTPEEAAAAAKELGGPVALKAVAPGLLHKTEAGAVRLSLDASDVEAATEEMREAVASAGHEVERFVVQTMVPQGPELLIGVVHDPVFGPVVACGAGGTSVELLKDVRVGLTPLTDLDAAEMLRSLATYPLLTGYRGSPPTDVGAVEELLLRVSALAEALPEVVELDCNPVVASPSGAIVVDARVRVERAPATQPIGARR